MIRHSGNTATRIDTSYGGEGATMKVYVHDELGRFVTVASLSLGAREVEVLLEGIRHRRAELDQPTLFDADETQPTENLRWLPPRP